jgi:hypothetical protein
MADTMTSQNIDLSSWNIYVFLYISAVDPLLFKVAATLFVKTKTLEFTPKRSTMLGFRFCF